MKSEKSVYNIMPAAAAEGAAKSTYRKLFVPLTGGAAALGDLLALSFLAAKITDPGVLAFQSLLFVFDMLFVLAAILIDFRFRYSVKNLIVYILFSLIFTIVAVSWEADDSTGRYMTAGGEAVFIISHFLFWAAAYLSFRAPRVKSLNSKPAALAIIAAAFIVATGYASFNAASGYFGQGIPAGSPKRAVIYTYDQMTDYYVASGLVQGKGNTVVIPEKFNGKPVGAISCRIFDETGIDVFTLESPAATLDFQDAEYFRGSNANLTVEVPRDLIEQYRAYVFFLGKEGVLNRGAFLSNSFFPSDLSEDEVCVTFAYDFGDMPATAYNDLLPVWISRKGAEFSLGSFSEGYLGHINRNDENDLAWNYANNGGYIMKAPDAGDGIPMIGRKIDVSIAKARIGFEKVYKINLTNGNDSKYSIPNSVKNLSSDYPGRYVTEAKADEFFASLPARTGFSVSWKADGISLNGGLSAYLKLQPSAKTVALTPYWTLNAPTIASVSASKPNIIYGDSVDINVTASHPSVALKYKLLKNSTVIYDKQASPVFNFDGRAPSDSATYTVTAFAEDPAVTSLVSSASKTITITINKKPLPLSWELPSGTYDGTARTVGCAYDPSDIVGSDTVALDWTVKTATNAGSYTTEAFLGTAAGLKYEIPAADKTKIFAIAKRPVDVQWGTGEFTYNGENQRPAATAFGIEADGELALIFAGEKKNAGGLYTAYASVVDANYSLNNPAQIFSIAKKKVTAVWSAENSFVYNGGAQRREINSITGAVPGETSLALTQISFLDWANNIHAGNYTVSAVFAANSNYEFLTEESGAYQITKRPVYLIRWDEASIVYDGAPKVRTVGDISNALTGEKEALLASLIYTGAAIEAGHHEVTATLPENSDYQLTYPWTSAFTVEQRPLTISAPVLVKTYDNAAYPAFTPSVSNLAPTDSLADVGAVSFGGSAVGAIFYSPSSYDLVPSINPGDEGIRYGNYLITYAGGSLTINKRPINFTVTGGTKIYDGNPYSAFGYGYDGLAPGDSLADVYSAVNYSGEAVTAINYSPDAYFLTVELVGGVKAFNYSPAITSGSVVINKRPIEILKLSSPSLNKIYNGTLTHYYGFLNGVDYSIENAVPGEITGVNFSALYNSKNVAEANKITLTFGSLIGGEGYSAENYIYTAGLKIDYAASISPSGVYPGKIFGYVANFSKIYDGTTNGSYHLVKDVDYVLQGAIGGEIPDIIHTDGYLFADTGAGNQYRALFGSLVAGAGYIASNYSYTPGQALEFEAEIDPRPATVYPADRSKVYDGDVYAGFTVGAAGLAPGDTAADIGSFAFGGASQTAINAGSYQITLALDTAGTKYGNYTLSFGTGTLTINKKSVEPVWTTSYFIYDGLTHAPAVVLAGQEYAGDMSVANYIYYDINNIELSGMPSAIGTYFVKAVYSSVNYILNSDLYQFTIEEFTE
jgi:hypothetical protein